ncbi:MAG: sulfurtransferase TusA family protein [Acidimicrobiia bacterium]|nr:MAG: sulfurtransferase TusA family protein [Acidimicrobiia bacterium]
MSDQKPSAVLDNRRSGCATGLIRADAAIDRLGPGEVLAILTRDRFAPAEVRLWAEKAGHRLVAVERAGVWPLRYRRLLVERGETP